MSPSKKYVAYYRVSTRKQGRSGLGLEAQQFAAEEHLRRTGGRIIKAFKEVESGKKSDRERPQLRQALQLCRVYGATLLVAKFDRLSRDAAFLLTLKAGNVPIVAADMPDVNEDVVGFMAVVAQIEGRQASARTKAALAAAKRRGTKLGTPANLKPHHQREGRVKGRYVRTVRARERAEDLRATLAGMQDSGIASLRGLAAALNREEIRAPRGGEWSPVQVRRVLARLNTAA